MRAAAGFRNLLKGFVVGFDVAGFDVVGFFAGFVAGRSPSGDARSESVALCRFGILTDL